MKKKASMLLAMAIALTFAAHSGRQTKAASQK